MEKGHKVRRVLSFTACPQRVSTIPVFARRLSHASRNFFDVIYACIPSVSLKNIPYDIPESTFQEFATLGITHVPCEDSGPITKILPVLALETDPDTILCTVDDDLQFAPKYFKNLLEKAREHPNEGISGSGWLAGKTTLHTTLITEPLKDTQVDWIEGCSINCFRRWMLDVEVINEIRNKYSWADRNDDHVLSLALASKGIPRVVVSMPRIKYCSFIPENNYGGISGEPTFMNSVDTLMNQLRREGIYGNIPAPLHSAFFFNGVIALCVLVFAVVCLFNKKWWPFGLVLLWIAFSIGRTAMYNVWAYACALQGKLRYV